jgi:hypothetical protein
VTRALVQVAMRRVQTTPHPIKFTVFDRPAERMGAHTLRPDQIVGSARWFHGGQDTTLVRPVARPEPNLWITPAQMSRLRTRTSPGSPQNLVPTTASLPVVSLRYRCTGSVPTKA